jgi:hypothetical protein
MKDMILWMVTGIMALASCVHSSVKNEEQVRKQQQVTAFEQVDVVGSPSVYYTQSNATSLRIEGPKSKVERIEVTNDDGILRIKYKGGDINLFGSSSKGKVKVYITSPDLIGVTVHGSGDFICKDSLDTDNLNVGLHGSGDIKFRTIVCDHIKAEVVGSGDVELGNVQTQTAHIQVTGSGDASAQLKHCAQTDISLTGSGDVKVGFTNGGQANCQVTGSGDIDLRGELRQLTKSKSGSGSINTDHLKLAQ